MTAPLPPVLAQVISRSTEPFSVAKLRESAQLLSTGYRSRENIRSTLSPVDVAAYLGARFPSTYAVARHVWDVVASHPESPGIATVLDAGAGPGTASWAAHEVMPGARFTLLERDASWRSVAHDFASSLNVTMQFAQGSIDSTTTLEPHDAVVACYALNELPEAQRTAAITRLWRAARKLLIVIEPGTPLGFGVTRQVRDLVLQDGGFVIAPCTHDLACPMEGRDWCHFPVRVQRLAIQRTLKDAELAHEDEKFSYVAVVRGRRAGVAGGRVITKPIRAKGHIHLDVCADGQVTRQTMSKKMGDAYRAAKDCDWGELWPPQPR